MLQLNDNDLTHVCPHFSKSKNIFLLTFKLTEEQLEGLRQMEARGLPKQPIPACTILCDYCYNVTKNPQQLFGLVKPFKWNKKAQKELSKKKRVQEFDFNHFAEDCKTRGLPAQPNIGDVYVTCDHLAKAEWTEIHWYFLASLDSDDTINHLPTWVIGASWLIACNKCNNASPGADDLERILIIFKNSAKLKNIGKWNREDAELLEEMGGIHQ